MDYQFIIVFAFINYTCNYVSVHVAILVCAHTHTCNVSNRILIALKSHDMRFYQA